MVSKLSLDNRTKLKTNIDIDVKSAGQPSKGVVGAASVAPVLATVPKPVAAAGAFKLQEYVALLKPFLYCLPDY